VRRARAAGLVLVLVACCAAPRPLPPLAGPAEDEPAPAESGAFALDTSAGHVVRLTDGTSGATEGRLRIASPISGVLVRVDAGGPMPLPVEMDVAVGSHVVVASCPEGRMETVRPSVSGGETVTLRVCGSPPSQ